MKNTVYFGETRNTTVVSKRYERKQNRIPQEKMAVRSHSENEKYGNAIAKGADAATPLTLLGRMKTAAPAFRMFPRITYRKSNRESTQIA